MLFVVEVKCHNSASFGRFACIAKIEVACYLLISVDVAPWDWCYWHSVEMYSYFDSLVWQVCAACCEITLALEVHLQGHCRHKCHV